MAFNTFYDLKTWKPTGANQA